MSNSRKRFAPPLWGVVLYAVVCVSMLALGRWQLLRADEKIQILEAAADAAERDVLALDAIVDDAALLREAQTYTRASMTGRWISDRQFLWDNRAHAGQAGVEVITPLRLEDGRLALVNRGWRRLEGRRDVLPDVSLEVDDLSVVVGALSRPSRGFARGEAFDSSADWPRYLQYFDYEAIAAALQSDVLPVVLQAQHSTPGPWLVSNWQPAASGPEKHYAYAVQWFGMAAALTVIFIVVNRRTTSDAPNV